MTDFQRGSPERAGSHSPSIGLGRKTRSDYHDVTRDGTIRNSVVVEGDLARVSQNERAESIPVLEFPPEFIRWQLDEKHRTYDAIEKKEYVGFSASHLPVVGTLSSGDRIPNLTNKGVGLTPKNEYLEQYVDLLEDTVNEIAPRPSGVMDSTRSLRIAAARELYAHPEHIDWRRLALLEIFEGTTLRNLRTNPFASVLWTGSAPKFLSFQVDCLVEIISPDDLRYRFAWAMRRLFEYEPFHVVQTMFPFAYCFWVVGWKNKTPVRRHPGSADNDSPGEVG